MLHVGRPKKLNKSNIRYIARLASTGKTSTATAIRKEFEQHCQLDVHRTTVSRYLRSCDLGPNAKRKRPLLSSKHRKARLAFARKYKDWTVDDWKRVFFRMRLKSIAMDLMDANIVGESVDLVLSIIM